MDAIDPETLLTEGFQWFVIPHGLNANGKLRISIRVVPRLQDSLIKQPVRVGKVAGRAAREILLDWPGFLGSGVKVHVSSCPPDAAITEPTDPLVKIDLTQSWRDNLATKEIGRGLAAQIWRVIVRPGLAITPAPRKPSAPSFKVLREVAQQAGAIALRKTLGGIYAEGLAEAAKAGSSPGSLQGEIKLALRAAQATLISPLATLLPALEHPADIKTLVEYMDGAPKDKNSRLAFGIWFYERLRAVGLNLSRTGMNALAQRLQHWTQGSYELVEEVNHEFLPAYILDRLLTMVPELNENWQTPADQPEFHRELAKLTLHPWLLETLGLSLHAEIDPAILDTSRNALYVAGIETRFGLIKPREQVRVVCSVATDNSYYPSEKNAAPNALRYKRGCVNLGVKLGSMPLFTLEQLETDALSEKLIQAAQSWSTQIDAGVKSSLREVTLATLPTTGISLLMRQPAQVLQDKLTRAADRALQDVDWQTLYAEDLVVGYRPDIAPLSLDTRGGSCVGPWKSLVGRQLTSLKAKGIDWKGRLTRAPQDEGIVTLGTRMLEIPSTLTKSGGESKLESTRIPFEEVFRWRGWSLAASPVECPRESSSSSGSSLTAIYRSAGGLPKQRVGWGYRVGMRAVYLDGRSLSLQEAQHLYETSTDLTIGTSAVGGGADESYLPFFRYEPIQPPDLLVRSRLERETIPTQRGDFLTIASRETGEVQIPSTERVLVPPRIDLEAAIRLGMFDQSHHAPPEGAFAGVRLNENGTFPTVGGGCISDIFGDEQGGDTCYIEDSNASRPKTPYLPDPWAQRLIIGIYRCDGTLLGLEYHDYYSEKRYWPDCRPLVLRVEAAARDILRDEGYDVEWRDATLVLKVAPGIALRLCCWHEITEQMLANSGIVETMAHYLMKAPECAKALNLNSCSGESALDPPEVPLCDRRDQLIQCLSQWHRRTSFGLRPFLASGRAARDINLMSFSMLNPTSRMDVAHLVPVPVRAAQFCEASLLDGRKVALLPTYHSTFAQRFDVRRENLGQTLATFHGDIEFHRSSTVRLDCVGEWQEYNDEVGTKPQQHSQSHPLFTFESIVPALDTPSVYGATEPAADYDLLLLSGIRNTISRDTNRDLQDRVIQYDFVDAKARLVKFGLCATSRFLKNYPKALQDKVSETGPQTSRWVKATKPPAPPAVAYVVPLLQSFNQTHGQQRVQRRHGNAFRIWLERPWYSSGEGELLALVCWPGDLFRPRGGAKDYLLEKTRRAWGTLASATVPRKLEGLYTGWGHDPIWKNKGKLRFMPPGAFANRLDYGFVRVAPSQLLNGRKPEPSDERVGLALYKPQYHEKEQRWYADITIKPDDDAYYPFVRLCLARYQPNAIEGCELSEIVSSEFIQLLPERVASVQVKKATATSSHLHITIAGPSSLQLSEETQSLAGCVTAPMNKMVVRVDQAHRNLFDSGTHENKAWVPIRNQNGHEETELEYQNGLWTLPNNQSLPYRLESNVDYSVYLEERQTIKIDKDQGAKGGNYPYLPDVQSSERVVYVDRVIIPG